MNKPFGIFLFAHALGYSCFFLRIIFVGWYVLEKTDSLFLVGLLSSIPIIIFPLGSIYGGKFADTISRKLVVVIARTSEAILLFMTALFINLEIYPLASIGIISIFYGISNGIGAPSRINMIIDILGKENVSKGNSLSELVASIASAIIPAIASILLNIFTIEEIFWILPLITFVGAIGMYILYFLLPNQTIIKKESDNISLAKSFIFALKDKYLAPIFAIGVCVIIWGSVQPLIPAYSRDILNLDGRGYTLIQSANYMGAIIGCIILLNFGNKIITGKLLSLWMILFAVFIFIFFTINNPYIAGVALLIANLNYAIWITSLISSIQIFSDEKFVGRNVSIFAIMFGIGGFAYMIGGFLGDLVGVNPTMLIACLLIMTINLLVLSYSENYRKLKI